MLFLIKITFKTLLSFNTKLHGGTTFTSLSSFPSLTAWWPLSVGCYIRHNYWRNLEGNLILTYRLEMSKKESSHHVLKFISHLFLLLRD